MKRYLWETTSILDYFSNTQVGWGQKTCETKKFVYRSRQRHHTANCLNKLKTKKKSLGQQLLYQQPCTETEEHQNWYNMWDLFQKVSKISQHFKLKTCQLWINMETLFMKTEEVIRNMELIVYSGAWHFKHKDIISSVRLWPEIG